jgi:hypothetical protein
MKTPIPLSITSPTTPHYDVNTNSDYLISTPQTPTVVTPTSRPNCTTPHTPTDLFTHETFETTSNMGHEESNTDPFSEDLLQLHGKGCCGCLERVPVWVKLLIICGLSIFAFVLVSLINILNNVVYINTATMNTNFMKGSNAAAAYSFAVSLERREAVRFIILGDNKNSLENAISWTTSNGTKLRRTEFNGFNPADDFKTMRTYEQQLPAIRDQVFNNSTMIDVEAVDYFYQQHAESVVSILNDYSDAAKLMNVLGQSLSLFATLSHVSTGVITSNLMYSANRTTQSNLELHNSNYLIAAKSYLLIAPVKIREHYSRSLLFTISTRDLIACVHIPRLVSSLATSCSSCAALDTSSIFTSGISRVTSPEICFIICDK